MRSFTPPPADFDPLTASDRELLVHGYPTRPDARIQPELAARWQEMMSRPLRFVQPEFELLPDTFHGPRCPASPADTAGLTDTTLTDSAWSGAVVLARPDDTIQSVTGEWSVPNVGHFVPCPPSYTSQWIGIDGDGSPNVVQAGSATDKAGLGSSTYLWYEWTPQPSVKITNIDVNPGDVIYGLICAQAPTTAAISLVNVTAGTMASFSVHPPATGTALVGNSAEWIVEAPLINNVQSVPGHFGVVFFDNAFASTAAHASLDGGKADELFSMVQNGVTLSVPRELGSGVLKCTHQPSASPASSGGGPTGR